AREAGMTSLTPGDPAPWFTARTPAHPDFQFGTAAGRPIVLSFICSAGSSPGKAMLESLLAGKARLDNQNASLFVVSQDGEDERQGRIAQAGGVHVFWDEGARIAAIYGLAGKDALGQPSLTLTSFVLDPMLRVAQLVPFRD